MVALRDAGWRDISLEELSRLLDHGKSGRYFHVTIDDGARGDRECVDALRSVSCPATLFVPLDAMTAEDRTACEALRASSDVAIRITACGICARSITGTSSASTARNGR